MHLQVLDDGVLHLLEEGESLLILDESMIVRLSPVTGRPEVKFVSDRRLPDEFSISDELRSDHSIAFHFRDWQTLLGQDTTLVVYNGDSRREARVAVEADLSDEETPFG